MSAALLTGRKNLPANTWLFGEEYNLWVSDKDLNRVLEKHRANLDPAIVIDDPVQVIGKKRSIVDLMLSRATRRHRADDIEHLVVELKAPKVKIGADEITQGKASRHIPSPHVAVFASTAAGLHCAMLPTNASAPPSLPSIDRERRGTSGGQMPQSKAVATTISGSVSERRRIEAGICHGGGQN